MKIFKYLAFSALLAMSVSGTNAQDYDKGLAALNAGDYQTALKEFLPLAESGNANAQNYIGLIYSTSSYVTGSGVIQNYVEAVKWYRLAADQGHAVAQLNLGFFYSNGAGVIQNNVMAHMWYNISSANGQENSAALRDDVASKMTQEAIEKAQEMAQECISSGYKNCGD